MSEVKVNKISPRSGTDVTLGDSGDTFTIPSGATINNQGTAVNFGATGSASWVTTVKTTGFTAVAGEGYFCNTTSGGFSVNLPAGTAGAVVAIKDYAGTFDTGPLTLVQNGSDKIGGSTDNAVLGTEGIAVTLVFIDSTRGWLVTDSGLQSEAPQTYTADFLVIAGGGGAGYYGGGGAGGYRNSFSSESSGGGGSSETALSLIPGTVYTITVGAGGTSNPGSPSTTRGTSGGDSSISGTGITTITSTGGGAGGSGNGAQEDGLVGGSGGGGGGGFGQGAAGTSNQGFAGGNGQTDELSFTNGGGGGGASAAGTNGTLSPNTGGTGGAGLSSSITGSAVTRGGGGGAAADGAGNTAGPGGAGGGGNGSDGSAGGGGTANTGGGGGGSLSNANGGGGSGVVILRMATANYSGTTSGSPTVSTDGTDTILIYNGSGSYTA